MATVRITQELTSRVLDNLSRKLETTAYKFDANPYLKEQLPLEDMYRGLVPDGILTAVEALPQQLRHDKASFTIDRIVNVDEENERLSLSYNVLHIPNIMVPGGMADYIATLASDDDYVCPVKGMEIIGTAYRDSSLNIALSNEEGSMFKDAVDHALAELKKRNASYEQRTEAASIARRVLESHTTLKAALRTWPALWDVLPYDYKRRHKEVTVRAPSTPRGVETVGELDTKKLTARLMAAKIQGED